jgi:hypothetical protein
MDQVRAVEDAVCGSPVLAPVLARWSGIQLPDCWLVAGAVAQAVWNSHFGLAADHGMRDIDIVYHDPFDLSANGEAEHEERIGALFADLPVRIDVKNEARVHLWYEARFGNPIAPYPSTQAAIATFPTTATAVGVRPVEGGLEVEAPFGLSDMCGVIVRPNKAQITREIYEAKVTRWRALWPRLDIRPW